MTTHGALIGVFFDALNTTTILIFTVVFITRAVHVHSQSIIHHLGEVSAADLHSSNQAEAERSTHKIDWLWATV